MSSLTFPGRRWQRVQARAAQDSTYKYGQAASAQQPAASGATLWRSAAPTRGSQRGLGT